MNFFSSLSLPANFILFVIFGTAIWFAGTRLSYLADAIGDRTGIGRAMMGLVFLAGITELPELVTTSAASLRGDAALALNNMFGGITMQTAILAVADATALHATLTSYPRKLTPILSAIFLILLLTTILVIVSLGDISLMFEVGLGTTLLAGIYFLSISTINYYEKEHVWRPVDLPTLQDHDPNRRPSSVYGLSLRMLAFQSCGVAAVIVVCGVMLVEVSANIATLSGLGSSFIGVTLLAATTSLPELSTTIAAVRIRAYTMAISNIFGSNLIMVFVLFPADMFYRQGEILREAGDLEQLALLSGIIVTTIYVIGLLMKRMPRFLGMGMDSVLVLTVYLASLYIFYIHR